MAITIRTAQVLPGTEIPAGDGLTGALRCTLILPDGTQRAAILKRAPLGEVAAEAFAALLLRAWGLPVPEPFIVDEPEAPAFASADAGYPNLKQRLGLPHRHDAAHLGAGRGCRRGHRQPRSQPGQHPVGWRLRGLDRPRLRARAARHGRREQAVRHGDSRTSIVRACSAGPSYVRRALLIRSF
jgi:hypothetical protein